jgi:hypothetical protein
MLTHEYTPSLINTDLPNYKECKNTRVHHGRKEHGSSKPHLLSALKTAHNILVGKPEGNRSLGRQTKMGKYQNWSLGVWTRPPR